MSDTVSETDIKIKQCTVSDIDEIETLYSRLIDYLCATENYPGWEKGVYPTREDAEAGVRNKCLFAATINDEIIGSLILRHEQEDAYKGGNWNKKLDYSEVFVIHTFVVKPEFLHHGIGALLLDFAEKYALKNGVKALRLDTYIKNTPAIELYKKCGFREVGNVSLGLEAVGLDRFYLFEKILKA